MAVAAESNNYLHMNNAILTKLVLNKIFYWTFPAVKTILLRERYNWIA